VKKHPKVDSPPLFRLEPTNRARSGKYASLLASDNFVVISNHKQIPNTVIDYQGMEQGADSRACSNVYEYCHLNNRRVSAIGAETRCDTETLITLQADMVDAHFAGLDATHYLVKTFVFDLQCIAD